VLAQRDSQPAYLRFLKVNVPHLDSAPPILPLLFTQKLIHRSKYESLNRTYHSLEDNYMLALASLKKGSDDLSYAYLLYWSEREKNRILKISQSQKSRPPQERFHSDPSFYFRLRRKVGRNEATLNRTCLQQRFALRPMPQRPIEQQQKENHDSSKLGHATERAEVPQICVELHEEAAPRSPWRIRAEQKSQEHLNALIYARLMNDNWSGILRKHASDYNSLS
jgi:hypothetical protein